MSKTKEVVINKCFGGFRLSDEALEWLMKNKGWKLTEYNESGHGYKDETAQLVKADPKSSLGNKYYMIHDRTEPEVRENKDIIACIKALGEKANSKYSELTIIKIPSDVKYEIDEYDGLETIHEEHRSWR